jgi:alkylated DNA nucleotide flippase Atl1
MSRVLPLAFIALALPVFGQVPVIIEEIGELEGVRDPKCYATASRLEDFIYGTPLETEARFEKIALQKAWIREVWAKASAGGAKEIDAAALRPVLQASVPYTQMPDGSFIVGGTAVISARDKRQYGSVAYALRASPRPLPWQRVMGQRRRGVAQVTIKHPVGAATQRQLLEKEGVRFTKSGGVELSRYGA